MGIRTRKVAWGAVVLATALFGSGCSPPDPPPNVLLVTVDTLRPDFLGAYGFQGESSPNFDAFAARSLIFERAIAASSRTAPSHASLFTSRWVRDHSIGYRNGASRLGDEPTLPELLANAGYDTAAFIGNTMLKSRIGLDRGFAVFDDELPDTEMNRADVFERVAEKTTPRAISWLARERDAPFFLWVQYNDPHGPYTPPPEYSEPFQRKDAGDDEALPALEIQRGVDGIPAYQVVGEERRVSQYVARYAGEIRYFDASLGSLLEAAEKRTGDRPLLVVITADHGESLGENGIYFSHGFATTPDLVHIPLVIYAPNVSPRRIRSLVHHVDLMPTVLEWVGLPVPDPIAGSSLVPLMKGGDDLPERNLYADVGAEIGLYRGDRFVRSRTSTDLGGVRAGLPVVYRWLPDGSLTPIEIDIDLVEDTLRYPIDRVPMQRADEPGSDDRERMRALGYLK